MKKLLSLMMALPMIFGTVSFAENAETDTDASLHNTALVSEYWTDRSQAAASLNDYLTAVTDTTSPDYISVKDRIAVFDLDGTLMCETY